MNDKKVLLVIVVNGAETQVEQNENAPLRAVVGKALEQTGNSGQSPDNWELRDSGGTVLDLARKIKDYGFTDGTRLFLNLRTGAAG